MDYYEEIKSINSSMRRTYYLMFPFRNNKGVRKYYYHRLISAIGYDNWDYCNVSIVNEWESAQNSFDKMRGIIRAWKVSGVIPEIDNEKKQICEKKHENELYLMELATKEQEYKISLRMHELECENKKLEVTRKYADIDNKALDNNTLAECLRELYSSESNLKDAQNENKDNNTKEE